MNIAVLGLGWWGSKLLRNLSCHPDVGALLGIDPKKARRANVAESLNIPTFESPYNIIESKKIQAVVIATPPNTHYELARLALESEKHVLITKPPTQTIKELEKLIDLAEKYQCTFMMDSTFVYSEPMKKIKELLDGGLFPDIRFVQSLRYGNDLRMHHIDRLISTMLDNGIDVIQDLLFHDLAILNYLFPDINVKPTGLYKVNSLFKYTPSIYRNKICDTAFIRLDTGSFPIHVGLSWVLPERRRELLIADSVKQLVFDDLKDEKKISLFWIKDKREEIIEHGTKEPLFLVVDHFVKCILNGRKPDTDGQYMKKVMKSFIEILEYKK